MRIMAVGVLLGLIAWATQTQADLGDTVREAKVRGALYESQFGAILPLFKTDADGIVIWECWAAPAEVWTRDQAFALAQQLVPAKTASESPKYEGVDGTQERYVYPDGTVVNFWVFQGGYHGVEVHDSSYSGNRC